jgi:hypothetical protein
MPQNSISFCIDQAGVYYRIPIACINDPVNYEKDYQNKILHLSVLTNIKYTQLAATANR